MYTKWFINSALLFCFIFVQTHATVQDHHWHTSLAAPVSCFIPFPCLFNVAGGFVFFFLVLWAAYLYSLNTCLWWSILDASEPRAMLLDYHTASFSFFLFKCFKWVLSSMYVLNLVLECLTRCWSLSCVFCWVAVFGGTGRSQTSYTCGQLVIWIIFINLLIYSIITCKSAVT